MSYETDCLASLLGRRAIWMDLPFRDASRLENARIGSAGRDYGQHIGTRIMTHKHQSEMEGKMLEIDWADAAEQLAGEDHIDQIVFLEAYAQTLRDEIRPDHDLRCHIVNIRDCLCENTKEILGELAQGGDDG